MNTVYAQRKNGDEWQELLPHADVVFENVQYSYTHVAGMSESERNEILVFTIQSAAVPENKIAVGNPTLETIEGKPVRVYELDDKPLPPTLKEMRSQKLAELAGFRWQKEEGGASLPDGTVIASDRVTQGKLTAAYVKALTDSTYEITNFKVASGVWVTLDAATIILMANALEAHVQVCFDRERRISDLILASTTSEALNVLDFEALWELPNV